MSDKGGNGKGPPSVSLAMMWDNVSKYQFDGRFVSMSPRPDVSEERKNQILEAAMTVFARRGFDEARMDDIAQEAGLSKGTLYLYYKRRERMHCCSYLTG